MSPFLLENYAFNGQTYQATLPSGNVTSISELCSVVEDEQAEIEWKESGYWNFSLTSFETFPIQKHELGSKLVFSRKPHSKSLSLKKHHSINYNSIRCLDFRRFIFPVHETITATEKLSTGRAWLWNPVGQKSLVCKWQIPGVCDRDLFPNEQSNDETALSRKEGVFADIRRDWNGCASRFCHYHQPCITLLPVCFWRVAHFFDMGLKSFQIVQLWTTSTEQEFFPKCNENVHHHTVAEFVIFSPNPFAKQEFWAMLNQKTIFLSVRNERTMRDFLHTHIKSLY